jgi:type III restriction enzyme
MLFVESIQNEGVILERRRMDNDTKAIAPLVVEIDNENVKKDIDKLDINIPVLTPRIYREYKNLEDLVAANLKFQEIIYHNFSEEEKRQIVFKDITTGEISHVTELDTAGVADYQSVIAFFVQTIKNDLKLVSGYDVLYGKVKGFIRDALFGKTVDLEDANTLRNLSELAATKTILETFKNAINELTVKDKGGAEIRDYIKLRNTRPFVVKDQEYVIPKKSVFNRIVGDSHYELQFAAFLDECEDVVSYVKNYFAVNFKLDYVNADGNISNYYPDFIVKLSERKIVIVETKGQEDLDVPLKMERLKLWCADINNLQDQVKFDYVFVPQEDYEQYRPQSFQNLLEGFMGYK